MKTVKFTVLGEPTGKGRPQTKVMYSEKVKREWQLQRKPDRKK